jgi:Uma2 family endonuclease
MATVHTDPLTLLRPPKRIPPLQNGDRLDRTEFERRYAAMPHVTKAELIEGIVYMPSPVSNDHSQPHFDLITSMGFYSAFTPGVAGGDNGTLRLDMQNEPQPDAFLRILATHGGRATVSDDGYIVGGPELVAEVGASRASIDLHAKFQAYQRNGVQEYIVWRVFDREIDWLVLRGGRYERLPPAGDGVLRSEILPGLWLNSAALVGGDMPAVLQVAQQGVASPDHAAFVARLRQTAAAQQP